MADKRFRPIRHGTVGGYQRCQPSCDACKAAWNAYYARYRQEHPRPRTEMKIRAVALEMLASRHPSEFLALYEKASQQ